MHIPKIKFEVMTLDANIELIKWAFFEDNGSLDIHTSVLKYFKELAIINDNNTKEETYKLIEQFVTNHYEKYKDILSDYVEKYNTLWQQYNDIYFNTLSNYLNIKWPNELKIIRCDIGFIPVYPRYLDTFDFSLAPNITGTDLIEICAHETCHFLWFLKWKELYPNCSRREFDSPYIPWQYSEMVVDPILNSKEVNNIININAKAYDSFYEIKDENDLYIMDVLRDIFNQDISIESKIIKGYDYISQVLNKKIIRSKI